MAEPEDKLFEEDKAAGGGGPSRTRPLVRLGILAGALAAGVAGGYFLGGLFRGPSQAAAEPIQPAPEPAEPAPPAGGATDFEYVDFEPVTVNLNEPRLARYVRATITVGIRPADKETASGIIGKRKKEMVNWMTVYLAGLTLEDVRGPKNLNRIRREMQDAFNDLLWPGRRGLIDHVLFKEFAVQ